MAQQLYPIVIDLTGRKILIVGAGAVGARKAKGVLAAGASDVMVVAPKFADDMPEGVQRIEREFQESDLEGVELCFAATDNRELNSRIVELCQARGVLVNRADRDERRPGTFTVPAVHRAGPVTVAVSASGSPRLAAVIRDEIAQALDDNWAVMGEAALDVREKIVALIDLPQARRAQMLRTLVAPEAVEAFRRRGRDGLARYMAEQFPELGRSLA